jgi:hypothetical protein
MSYSRSFLGAGNRQTLSNNNTTSYRAIAPIGSHFRDATCAEVNCDKYVNGWWIALNPKDETHQQTVIDLKERTNLKYKTMQHIDPVNGKPNGFIRYEFYPGQECLQNTINKTRYNQSWHKVSLERPVITIKKEHNRYVKKEHSQWVDEMDDHLHELKKEIG